MNYTISYERRPGYLYVQIEGIEKFEAAVDFWENLVRKCKDDNIEKILIVDKVSGKLKTIEIHRLSVIVAKLIAGLNIAFIDPKEETYSSNAFGETVVANNGGMAKLFRTEKEGIKWLLS
ncbi:MAG: hypothetical protein KKA84_07620 [Bacteroidetes bacterium]|nr:hypothetical protein [Bacteroidota bacterium]